MISLWKIYRKNLSNFFVSKFSIFFNFFHKFYFHSISNIFIDFHFFFRLKMSKNYSNFIQPICGNCRQCIPMEILPILPPFYLRYIYKLILIIFFYFNVNKLPRNLYSYLNFELHSMKRLTEIKDFNFYMKNIMKIYTIILWSDICLFLFHLFNS